MRKYYVFHSSHDSLGSCWGIFLMCSVYVCTHVCENVCLCVYVRTYVYMYKYMCIFLLKKLY